jgi:hypothetical protein
MPFFGEKHLISAAIMRQIRIIEHQTIDPIISLRNVPRQSRLLVVK